MTQPQQATDVASGWPIGIQRNGWLGADVCLAEVRYVLSATDIEAIDRLLAQCKAAGTALTSITREAFSDPYLDPVLRRLSHQLQWGKGIVVIAGLAPSHYSLDEQRIIYWGIGRHFGNAVSQGISGELMGEVRVRDTGMQDGARVYYKAGPAP